jgi:hypothetical protein
MYNVPVDMIWSEALFSLILSVNFTRPVNSTVGPLRRKNLVEANSWRPVRIHWPWPVDISSTLVGPVGTVMHLDDVKLPSLR